TKTFLDDLNLRSLEELPPLDDLGTLVESVPEAADSAGGEPETGEPEIVEDDSPRPGMDSGIGPDSTQIH
ncbi:MAG TPA: hypothetical protein VLN59_17195, partial [Burkholderiales bacterium]|nr:hypothetical protein [Burkholderiales bacterium]